MTVARETGDMIDTIICDKYGDERCGLWQLETRTDREIKANSRRGFPVNSKCAQAPYTFDLGHALEARMSPIIGKRHRASVGRAAALAKRFALAGAALPQYRVEKRMPLGTVWIYDRVACDAFLVYTAIQPIQFAGGHLIGKWYVRPAVQVCMRPISHSYNSWRDAVSGLKSGSWIK